MIFKYATKQCKQNMIFKYATEQSNVKSQPNVLHFNLLQMVKFSHKGVPSMRVYTIS